MDRRLVACGLAIWTVATIVLRVGGQHIVPTAPAGTLGLFALTLPAGAGIARRLCRRFAIPPEQWPAGAIALLAPTLLLDPLSSAFFPIVFPNMPPQVGGVFGGWMLCCAAGALLGVMVGRPTNR